MTPGIITEWVLIIALNGWTTDVDTFRRAEQCWQRQRDFQQIQQDKTVLSWCEKRPVKKLPVTLKDD